MAREYTQDYNNPLTRSLADSFYCQQGGNCTFDYLYVRNYTQLNSTNASEYCLNSECISDWSEVNQTVDTSTLVPYTGATGNVDLNVKNMTLNGINLTDINFEGTPDVYFGRGSDDVTAQYPKFHFCGFDIVGADAPCGYLQSEGAEFKIDKGDTDNILFPDGFKLGGAIDASGQDISNVNDLGVSGTANYNVIELAELQGNDAFGGDTDFMDTIKGWADVEYHGMPSLNKYFGLNMTSEQVQATSLIKTGHLDYYNSTSELDKRYLRNNSDGTIDLLNVTNITTPEESLHLCGSDDNGEIDCLVLDFNSATGGVVLSHSGTQDAFTRLYFNANVFRMQGSTAISFRDSSNYLAYEEGSNGVDFIRWRIESGESIYPSIIALQSKDAAPSEIYPKEEDPYFYYHSNSTHWWNSGKIGHNGTDFIIQANNGTVHLSNNVTINNTIYFGEQRDKMYYPYITCGTDDGVGNIDVTIQFKDYNGGNADKPIAFQFYQRTANLSGIYDNSCSCSDGGEGILLTSDSMDNDGVGHFQTDTTGKAVLTCMNLNDQDIYFHLRRPFNGVVESCKMDFDGALP